MKLSIGIPVYKVSRHIERCARSLFLQTYDDLEFVFVDDCSGDESIAVVRRVLEGCPDRLGQVKFVKNGRNSGQDFSRMRAVHEATGELMAFCDADDWVDPDFYEKMVRRMTATGADMVFAPIVRNEDEIPPVGTWADELDLTSEDYFDRAGEMAAFNSMVNKIYRRDRILDADIEVPQDVRIGEDMCRTVQLVAKCGRIVSTVGSAYHYRENASSSTRRFDEAAVVRGFMKVYDVLDRKLPPGFASRFRKLELTRIVFLGMRFGVLTKDEFSSYAKRLRSLDAVRLATGTNVRQQMLIKMAQVCFPLARIFAAALRCWKFKGF